VFRLDDDRLVLAPTDLTEHLACPHLTQQRLAIARGLRTRPRPSESPHADLIRERGEAHEAAQLARLAEECGGVADLSASGLVRTATELRDAADRTRAAMTAGTALIYQAVLLNGRWQGRADFLRRTDLPSALGDWSYEVLDTKLARHVAPATVHQLSLYSRLVAEVQKVVSPVAYAILGNGVEEPVELAPYAALHRHVTARLEAIVQAAVVETYPEPVGHCPICRFELECDARRRADDHLSLVAFASRVRRERLVDLGYPTVHGLAAAPAELDTRPLGADAYRQLRTQAKLEVLTWDTGEPTHQHLPAVAERGYARLPAASPGDVFFDLEGDPYVGDQGIEYLWGWLTASGYEHEWAHGAAAERAALERFVDRVFELRAAYPGMHVYHYAPHESSTLRRLALSHTTREEEVDVLLREGVLVDLYGVVRQALQVGEESYSLKRLERHHGFVRLETTVREGGGSIVTYEAWLETGEQSLLEAIRAYNEEDCASTASLRDWLVSRMRPEAEAELGVDFSTLEPGEQEATTPPAWLPDMEVLIARLTSSLPPDPAEDDADQAERRLLAQLLLYHRREGKPEWWRWFELRKMSLVDLEHERDALSGLVRMTDVPAIPVDRSFEYAYGFPEQEFKLDLGDVVDPQTGAGHKLVRIEDDRIWLRRGKASPPPAPSALINKRPIDQTTLRNALVTLATELADGSSPSPAARAILRREAPRLASGTLGASETELIAATLGLDRACLPVQGPPGTGKTYFGARMAVAAMRAGMRVGVTAFSHAAIQNFLHMVEAHAADIGFVFRGIYKGDGYDSTYGLVECCDDNDEADADHDLVAGTAWLFGRVEHIGRFARLFVDEAGQFPLANAVAVAPAAESVILLGDPQQLPHVTQATHPGYAGESVLEYLLGGHATIPEGRGVFLDVSWRMHPDVCAFVSERSYEGRLRPRDACANRRVDAAGGLTGAGLRVLAVEHEGRSQASPEEADAIASRCRNLLAGGMVTDSDGAERALEPRDILVVTPYNLARRCIAERVPRGVRVGTVDRFQGQEAPVVFFAMTCSSGEDVPRGLDFLFDDHRLNVAVSRAQCLAVAVLNPALLDADCHTLEAMRLVDGACRLVEMATSV
jgi:uncharacterized protein